MVTAMSFYFEGLEVSLLVSEGILYTMHNKTCDYWNSKSWVNDQFTAISKFMHTLGVDHETISQKTTSKVIRLNQDEKKLFT